VDQNDMSTFQPHLEGGPRGLLFDRIREVIAERRFCELASAVVSHRERAGAQPFAVRPYDAALYLRLRQLRGEL
jgi:hypothetical protein